MADLYALRRSSRRVPRSGKTAAKHTEDSAAFSSEIIELGGSKAKTNSGNLL